MEIINQKCTINEHTQKSNPNTTLKMDIKSQNKRGREEKRPTDSKQSTKWH